MSELTASPENKRPLAVTMGEPSGVGPELIARLWQERHTLSLPPFVYIGAEQALLAAAPDLTTQIVSDPSEAVEVFDNALPVIDIPLAHAVTLGELNPGNGATVIKSIDTAVGLAQQGAVSGIVTAPIHKAALYEAGFTSPGHTEYLARLCDMPEDASVMMLAAKDLRVIPVTIHIALKDVAKKLTSDAIIHAAVAANHDLKTRFAIKKPRLAIAALNPHAGENGAMGLEEATHITPAIWALKDEGIDVTGPLPGDTLFHEEARQHYDAVLCMYHDQALIPIKTVDFWGGVNVTLGLPIIRTSPDHGTALPIAGTGKARTESMLAAIRMAAEMAERSNHD